MSTEWRQDRESSEVEPGATLDALIGSTSDGIVCLDENLHVLLYNQAALRVMDADPDSLVGSEFLAYVDAEDRASVTALLRDLGQTELASLNLDRPFQFRFAQGGADPVPVEATVTQTITATGRIFAFFVRDVSEQVEAQRRVEGLESSLATKLVQLQESKERLTLLQAFSDFLQSCLSLSEAYAEVARFGRRLFPIGGSLAATEPEGKRLVIVAAWGGATEGDSFEPDDCWALRRGRVHENRLGDQMVCEHVPADSPPSLCLPLLARGECLGVLRVLRSAADPAFSEEDQEFLLAVADTVKLRLANLRLQEALRSRALPDGLTGLLRKASFVEMLRLEIDRARRTDSPLAVVSLDIPDFPETVATYGREVADRLQRAVAMALKECVDRGDIAGRLDDGLFAVAMTETRKKRAISRAQEILEETSRTSLPDGHPLPAVAIGVACYREHGETVGELLEAAISAGRDGIAPQANSGS
ncbi:MAG: diguanylate cyclase [Fimbriimonadaceae bacterium]|nr:diguanylate cyclase [Fimbriimonadaceae bacterium]QYK55375.1 MAG: diguanylate cyclase [Fimbriimonadaceae bacterium]